MEVLEGEQATGEAEAAGDEGFKPELSEAFTGLHNPGPAPYSTTYGGKEVNFAPGEKKLLEKRVAEFLYARSYRMAGGGEHLLAKCTAKDAMEWEAKNKKADPRKAVGAGLLSKETLAALTKALEAKFAKDLEAGLHALDAELEARLTDKVGKAATKAVLMAVSEEAKLLAIDAGKQALDGAIAELLKGAQAKLQEALAEAVKEKLAATEAETVKGFVREIAAELLPGITSAELSKHLAKPGAQQGKDKAQK